VRYIILYEVDHSALEATGVKNITKMSRVMTPCPVKYEKGIDKYLS